MAWMILVSITMLLPMFTCFLIQKNRPIGSLEDKNHYFNDDGQLVPYSDAMYRRDLRSPDQLNSPFLWLYKNYERKDSLYKVQMASFGFPLDCRCTIG